MRMKSDNSPSRSFRPWLYGMATVLVAAVIAQTALLSSQVTDSQSANVTATPTPTPTATVIHTVPPDPISVIGGGVTVRGSASLDWNNAPRATSYELRMLLNGVWTTLPSNGVGVTFSSGSGELSSPGARITGLPNYDFYHFSVRSVNSVGTSRWSPTLKVQNIPTDVATPTPVSADASNGSPTPTSEPTHECLPAQPPASSAESGSVDLAKKYPNADDLLIGLIEIGGCTMSEGKLTDCSTIYLVDIKPSGDVSHILSFLTAKGVPHVFRWGTVRAYYVPLNVAAEITNLSGIDKVDLIFEYPRTPFNPTPVPTPDEAHPVVANIIVPTPTSVCLTPIPQPSVSDSPDNVPRIYPKLRGLAENVVNNYEKARIRGEADKMGDRQLYVEIYLNGAFSHVVSAFLTENNVPMKSPWFSDYTFSVQVNVPVRLLGPLSELPEVVWVVEIDLGVPVGANNNP